MSPSVINWRCCSDQSAGPGSAAGTGSSGLGSHSCGQGGGPASSLSNPRPSSPGTGKAFSSIGAGKSRRRSAGRPPLDLELRTLIRRMARENPTWGRRRIQAELRFLGYEVAELTVAKYMGDPSPRPSSTWRTFLGAHIGEIVAVDFFVVPTLTFRLLFGFLILQHNRRALVHVNVTDHPTAAWTATNWSKASRKRPRPSTCSAIGMPSTGTCSYGG